MYGLEMFVEMNIPIVISTFQHSPNNFGNWEFTWDDMAAIDLPSMVNYALKVSGQPKLAYVGHSQGCKMALECFTSMAPNSRNLKYAACPRDFTDKISIFIALAPVSYLNHPGSEMVKILARLHVDEVLEGLGVNEFLPSTKQIQKWEPRICSNSILEKEICMNTYCLLNGCHGLKAKANETRLPLYMDRLPAGTSTLNAGHWAQLVRSGNFQMFDYGMIENYARYHQLSPPQIELRNLHVDIAVYHGGLDVLADVRDVQRFLSEIPSSRVKNVMYLEDYGHIDFVWGIENYRSIYVDVLKRIADSFK